MKRRSFLKTVALGAGSLPFLGLPRPAFAEKLLPPHAAAVPVTPFDGPPGSWTLAVLPDTQNYSASYPEVFNRQCEWIVANREKHNILFVAHEGDITNNNNPPQWDNARKSIDILNRAGMPYCLATGNHDTGPTEKLCADRSTLIHQYFSDSDYKASLASGLLAPGKVENSWHHLNTPTGKFLIVGTEFAPRDTVVDWVKDVVTKNADRQAILLTHCYLYYDSTRYDWAKYGKEQRWTPKNSPGLVADGNANDGQDLWAKVVAPSKNVRLTLNGHVLNNGTGHLVSEAQDGHTVHQILANYQAAVQVDDGAGGVAYNPTAEHKVTRAYGGGGFMRLMQFHPDGKTVAVKTYSPWYDRWLAWPDQQFMLEFGKKAGV